MVISKIAHYSGRSGRSSSRQARTAKIIAAAFISLVCLCYCARVSRISVDSYIEPHSDWEEEWRSILNRLCADVKKFPKVDGFTVRYYQSWPGMLVGDEVDYGTVLYSPSTQSLDDVQYGGTTNIHGVTVDMMEAARKAKDPWEYLVAYASSVFP